MEKKMLKGMLVDVEKGKVVIGKFKDDLDEFYKLLNCRCIDIQSRRVGFGDRYLNFIVDDEGLLRSDCRISALQAGGQPMFVGNLLVFGPADEFGELMELSDADISALRDSVRHIGDIMNPGNPWPVLTNLRY